MLNPWFGMGLVLLGLVGLMGGLRLWQRSGRPHPELVRKLLHVGMGSVALSFPWLFADTWPVLLLAAITAPGMLALRLSRRLKERLGGVIGGVARSQSLGEVYFPLGVAGLFWLAWDKPLLYCIALLLLAVADAAAALVGVRYGRLRFAAGEKSAEGSLAFFVAAFWCAYLPLLLWGDVGGDEALLVAAVLGLWLTLVEAAAGRGLDNLFIPVVGFVALAALLNATAPVLTVYLLVSLALAACAFVWRSYGRLNDSVL
jgi:phytol kinase